MNTIWLTIICLVLQTAYCEKKHEKYTAEANKISLDGEKGDFDIKTLQRPFRMARLNLVWAKALHKLTDTKLTSLYTALKIHDKEELMWKQLRAQNKDKDGLKEAALRQKLIGIMSTYGLLEHFEDTQDPDKYKEYRKFNHPSDSHLSKSLFKDKKLNKLWDKAEIAGFTPEELKTLKEEFKHHQEKIDMYYNLLDELSTEGKKNIHENVVNEDELEEFNEILPSAEENDIPDFSGKKKKDYTDSSNMLRDHHHGIRENFDRLERLTSRGPNNQDFIDPKVQGLWRIVLASNFSENEIMSLKDELRHFESRLLKLHHLNAEHALHQQKNKDSKYKDKTDRLVEMEDHIKKQHRKVEKIQDIIEQRIFKHTEL